VTSNQGVYFSGELENWQIRGDFLFVVSLWVVNVWKFYVINILKGVLVDGGAEINDIW